MPNKKVFSKFALIGEDLVLKRDVFIEINEKGIILEINHKNPETPLEISENTQNHLLLPGLINSHTHIGDNFAKELGFNKDLVEIVAPPFGLKHKLLRQTSEEIIIKGIKNATLEMLSNGITCFIDFREGGVNGVKLLKKALENYSINCLIFGRFMDESEIDLIFELADGVGLASYEKISANNKKFVSLSKQNTKKLISCHCAEKNRNLRLINDMFDDKLVDIM